MNFNLEEKEVPKWGKSYRLTFSIFKHPSIIDFGAMNSALSCCCVACVAVTLVHGSLGRTTAAFEILPELQGLLFTVPRGISIGGALRVLGSSVLMSASKPSVTCLPGNLEDRPRWLRWVSQTGVPESVKWGKMLADWILRHGGKMKF